MKQYSAPTSAATSAPASAAGPNRRNSIFHCEEHDQVQPFQLKQLRTDVFDTYAICAALLTTLSASRFSFDNRDPTEILTGRGTHTTVHLSYLLQHVHILLASVCTAAGLQSMMVFVLCAMYSRSALAMPQVGAKVFEYFLQKTGKQRSNAFTSMLTCGLLSSFNLFVNCITMPSFVMRTEVPAVILDASSLLCAMVVMCIVVFTVMELWKILTVARIIFVPPDKLDEHVEADSARPTEQTPLVAERGSP